MGSRVRGANGESFREARSHVRTGRVVRGNSGSCERIRRRNKASKRVNPNRAAIKAAGVQGDRETSGTSLWLRPGRASGAERESIVGGGTEASVMWLRLRGRRLQKPPVIRPQCSRREGAGDNRRGASGVERRARFLRGETSEGEKPRDGLRHETRPRSSSKVKPLRGCESLGAAPEMTLGRVVSRGRPQGPSSEDTVKGQRDLRSWSSTPATAGADWAAEE
jgi:hypothetical protein